MTPFGWRGTSQATLTESRRTSVNRRLATGPGTSSNVRSLNWAGWLSPARLYAVTVIYTLRGKIRQLWKDYLVFCILPEIRNQAAVILYDHYFLLVADFRKHGDYRDETDLDIVLHWKNKRKELTLKPVITSLSSCFHWSHRTSIELEERGSATRLVILRLGME